MNESEIISLYFSRNESAVRETEKYYGKYLHKIAFNVLGNNEESEECVNDVFLAAWNRIPPAKPQSLAAFLAKITREKAVDVYRKKKAIKRSSFTVSLAELSDCFADSFCTENESDYRLLADAISDYLRSIPTDSANIFIERYFFCDSVKEIAKRRKASESLIKTRLYRMRKELKQHLKKEGFMP